MYRLFPPGDQLKSQNQQKLVQKRAPKKNHFWTNFGAHFGPKMAPKMGPKLIQKLAIFGFIFGSLVFEVLELFGCLLGAFMGLWSLSWEAPGPQKPRKTNGFLRFLQMQDFGSLRLLVALLGPSSPLLGPIWSQNGPQNGPKSGPKSAQKLVKKMDPKITPKMPVLGPKMAPKWGRKFRGTLIQATSGTLLAQDGPKMALRWLKMPKMRPRWPQDGPR